MKILSGILGLTLSSVVALASANAADIYRPSEGGYKDAPYAGVNWSGFYFGANVGGAWATDQVRDVNIDWCSGLGSSIGPCTYNNNATGVFGGGQLGFNVQRGNIVFGPEVDLGYMDLSHTAWQVAGLSSSTVSPGFYADVTARLGYAVDRTLVYAKGGYAYYGGSVSNWTDDGPNHSGSTSGLNGWTLGGGLEYKINPSLSLKAEYLHFDFGSVTNTVEQGGECTGPCPFGNKLSIDTAKIGVNYFVNSGYEPLK